MAVQPAKRPTLTIKVQATDVWTVKRLMESAPEVIAKVEELHSITVKSVTVSS